MRPFRPLTLAEFRLLTEHLPGDTPMVRPSADHSYETVTAATPIEPVELPKPLDLSQVHHAWLSPQGDWHPVDYEGHDYYAGSVLRRRPGALYHDRWIKLSSRKWYDEWSCGNSGVRVTQAQLNEIEKWFRSGASPVPFRPPMFEVA